MLRLAALLALVITSSCGKKDANPAPPPTPPPSAGSSSGSGSAAPPPVAAPAPPPVAATCIEKEDGLALIEAGVDDKAVTICLRADSAPEATKPTCYAVDLASGAWSSATAAPAKRKPAASLYEIKQDEAGVSICKGTACTKLAVKAPTKDEEGALQEYQGAVREDGDCVVLMDDSLDGAWFFDGKGKKVKALKLREKGAEGPCLHAVAFAGNLAYVATDVCAGPGAEGAYYDCKGKKVAWPEKVNPYGYTPQHVSGSIYALGDLNGGAVSELDAKTGMVRAVEIPKDCEDCAVLSSTPEQTADLLVSPAGKLIQIDASRVIVIHAEKGVEKTYKFPLCAAK
ncbi:MAG: hypothetical protein H0T46_36840 [Deltaproteobacteria bacterium]|nr:hypothetical protein [Deltaproteobacteria bacterium]